jgi:phosphoglycolate phosphatase
VDSAPDIAASVDYALRRIGREPPGLAQIKSYIGHGAALLIHRALTNSMDGVADSAAYESASEAFYAHYADNVCRYSVLYPRVKETLQTLQDRGYGLACVTNKPKRFSLPLLEALCIDRHFSICVSGDSLPRKKPDPAQLLFAAEHFKIPAERCTMVGDTTADIHAAQRASMPVIAVTYGYGDSNEMAGLQPTATVSTFGHIAAQLPSPSVAA